MKSGVLVAAGNRTYYGIETDIRRAADGRFVINYEAGLVRIAWVETT